MEEQIRKLTLAISGLRFSLNLGIVSILVAMIGLIVAENYSITAGILIIISEIVSLGLLTNL